MLAFTMMVFSIGIYHLHSHRPVAPSVDDAEGLVRTETLPERSPARVTGLLEGADPESVLARQIASILPAEQLKPDEIENVASCTMGRASEADLTAEQISAELSSPTSVGQRLFEECLDVAKGEALARAELAAEEAAEALQLERHVAAEAQARHLEFEEAIALTQELSASDGGRASSELGPPQS